MLRVTFSSNFDAIVCLDGTIPEQGVFKRCSYAPLIAADGAAVKLYRHYRLLPSYIVGDLDTLLVSPERELFNDIPLVQIVDQDTNDFEKVLCFAQQRGWKRLLVVGFQGEEPDHTLINWSVAVRYATTLELCFYDSHRYGIPLTTSAVVGLEVGETVSLVPQPEASVTTTGFIWELRGELLRWGVRESARNVVRRAPVHVEIHSGQLLLFCRDRLPKAPSFELL
ncbi:MAG: thiamine diphosphokinase [Candidatus Kapabacteria bacterium]|nr:thiamine diphosphokinase [Candidatus Kapabacteria bacterium]MDW8012581.1 thiamine diphosphokinase [Bacteroidota bacterium]